MPYKSKAQQRMFHYMESQGQMPKKTVNEFDKSTNFNKLPQRKADGGYIEDGDYDEDQEWGNYKRKVTTGTPGQEDEYEEEQPMSLLAEGGQVDDDSKPQPKSPSEAVDPYAGLPKYPEYDPDKPLSYNYNPVQKKAFGGPMNKTPEEVKDAGGPLPSFTDEPMDSGDSEFGEYDFKGGPEQVAARLAKGGMMKPKKYAFGGMSYGDVMQDPFGGSSPQDEKREDDYWDQEEPPIGYAEGGQVPGYANEKQRAGTAEFDDGSDNELQNDQIMQPMKDGGRMHKIAKMARGGNMKAKMFIKQLGKMGA